MRGVLLFGVVLFGGVAGFKRTHSSRDGPNVAGLVTGTTRPVAPLRPRPRLHPSPTKLPQPTPTQPTQPTQLHPAPLTHSAAGDTAALRGARAREAALAAC